MVNGAYSHLYIISHHKEASTSQANLIWTITRFHGVIVFPLSSLFAHWFQILSLNGEECFVWMSQACRKPANIIGGLKMCHGLWTTKDKVIRSVVIDTNVYIHAVTVSLPIAQRATYLRTHPGELHNCTKVWCELGGTYPNERRIDTRLCVR